VWTAGVPTGGVIAHDDSFVATIEYADGSVGTIFYSALGNFRFPKEYLEIYGGGSVMAIDNFKKAVLVRPNASQKYNLWKQDKGYLAELTTIVNAIHEGVPLPMTLEEIALAHIATFAMLESLKTHEAIPLSNHSA
jgi:predicted dehydrogenase